MSVCAQISDGGGQQSKSLHKYFRSIENKGFVEKAAYINENSDEYRNVYSEATEAHVYADEGNLEYREAMVSCIRKSFSRTFSYVRPFDRESVRLHLSLCGESQEP